MRFVSLSNHTPLIFVQNLRDGVLALGVLAFIIIDLIILIIYTGLEEGLNSGKVVLVPNKENPRTTTGVSYRLASNVRTLTVLTIFLFTCTGYKSADRPLHLSSRV